MLANLGLNQPGNCHHNPHAVALESYLERTEFEIAPITFLNKQDNLSARQREALKTLSTNKEINLKKGTKGQRDHNCHNGQKIQERLEQVSNKNLLKHLHVGYPRQWQKNIVKTLFDNGHIDNMTYKWLSSGQKPP